MNRSRITFFWILILVPTLIIGTLSVVLLRHEKDRLAEASAKALRDNGQLVADDIAFVLASLQEGLMETLRETPLNKLKETLVAMEAENPLIRNTFICRENGEILLPAPTEIYGEEKESFIKRYDSLFQGRVAWIERSEENRTQRITLPSEQNDRYPQVSQQANAPAQQAEPIPQQTSRSWSPQQINSYDQQRLANTGFENLRVETYTEFNKLSKMKGSKVMNTPPEDRYPTRIEEGWRPWFSENDQHLLGYIHAKDEALCYGVELELIALLSRLGGSLHAAETPGAIIALQDKNGKVLHYAGEGEITEDLQPDQIIPLGPSLAFYDIAIYAAGFGYGTSFGKSFTLISSLLVGIFMISIISGASLLINQARRSHQESMQKTSFVSNVSHELKTPLTTIRMYSELLRDGRVTEDGKRRHYLQTILNESERLSRLVNNVLDFGRLEQGRRIYQNERLDLREIIQDILQGQHLRIKEDFAIHFNAAPEPIPIHSDRDALEQILINITDNALKYARAGGEMSIDVERGPDEVVIHIKDRGNGVPTMHQKRIFDKFHRVDDSLTAEQGGSGLGLSIADRLIRGLGGRLEYKDRDGGGAIFTLHLPIDKEPSV
ncbi:MAG: signal transduction histidine kinase [Kiritimatiellia bacterium]|jgi:signal transduction histidine kinase